MRSARLVIAIGVSAAMLAAVVAAAVPSTAAVPSAAAPALASAGRAGPTAGAPCSSDASLLGFSDELDKATFDGTAVAGLSALGVTSSSRASSRLLALVDNVGTTPARFYDVSVKMGRRGLAARVRGVTTLRRPDGTPYTGADFDAEGLVVARRGTTVLVSSEVEPSIRRFRRSDGRQVAELPVPARFRVAPEGEATENQTFEALAAAPDGRTLYAGMEGPLAADGRDAEGRGLQRILRYHGRPGREYVPVAQYAYRTDPGLGLVELVGLGKGNLIALERGYTEGFGNTIRIYRVPTAGAPDVTRVGSLAAVTDPDAFLRKELLVDLAACPPSGATAKQPQPNPLLDNVEGMALPASTGRPFAPLPSVRHTLYLVSDDNGNPAQTTRVYALGVRLRLP